MLAQNSQLELVRFEAANVDVEDHQIFKKHIMFLTKKKRLQHREERKMHLRQLTCDPTNMFENILQQVENKDSIRKMPVRKFFNNTFSNILNDAIFALKKKQSKEPDN